MLKVPVKPKYYFQKHMTKKGYDSTRRILSIISHLSSTEVHLQHFPICFTSPDILIGFFFISKIIVDMNNLVSLQFLRNPLLKYKRMYGTIISFLCFFFLSSLKININVYTTYMRNLVSL